MPNWQHHERYQGYFSLRRTFDLMEKWFSPVGKIVACGTWSEPSYSTLGPDVTIVNAGLEIAGWQGISEYAKSAFSAVCAALLNRRDWDLAVFLTEDMLVGAIDWNSLLREFIARPETVLVTKWGHWLDWPWVMKRPAVSRFMHNRLRADLVASDRPEDHYLETELISLYGDSLWQPWPHVSNIRRDFQVMNGPNVNDEETFTWPFVRLPNPAYIQPYVERCTSKAKPVLSD
jgi:hypothetical protein